MKAASTTYPTTIAWRTRPGRERFTLERYLTGECTRPATVAGTVGKSTRSHHLKTLAGAGVIAEREAGTRKYLRLRRAELDRDFPGLIDLVLRAANPGTVQ